MAFQPSGSDVTDTSKHLQGIMIPAPRLEVWDAESTITEADPFPGRCVPGRATKMRLEAVSTPGPEDEDVLEVLCLRGGPAAPYGAEVVHRTQGETDYYGRDLPVAVDEAYIPTWDTDTNAGYRNFDAVEAANGTCVVVADNPDESGTEAKIVVRILGTDGTWGSWSTIHTEDSALSSMNYETHPSILRLPDGTLELYAMSDEQDYVAVTDGRWIRKWISEDHGVTWEEARLVCYSVGAVTPVKLRAAYGNGQWVIALSTAAFEATTHLASANGYVFEEVSVSVTLRRADVAFVDGYWWWLGVTSSTTASGKLLRTGDAFTAYDEGEEVFESSANRTAYGAAIAVGENGAVHCLWFSHNGSGNERLLYARGDVDSGDDGSAILSWDDAAFLTFPSACWWRGGLLVFANNDAGNADYSQIVLRLGGHSTLTRLYSGTGTARAQTGWSHVYVPIDQPENLIVAITAATTGSPTVSLDGALNGTGTAAQDASWQHTQGGATNREARLEGTGQLNASTSRLRVQLYQSDGTDRYGIEVRLEGTVTTDQIVLRDPVAGSAIGSAVDLGTTGDQIEIRMAVDDSGNGAAWYRVRTGITQRAWTLISSSTSLTQATTAGNSEAYWIMDDPTGHTGTWDIDLHDIRYVFNGVTRGHATGFTNPDHLLGAEIAQRPSYVHDGVSVQGVGLARGGDSWAITPGHTYAADNALPQIRPSPSKGLRTVDATNDQYLALQYDLEDSNTDMRIESRVLALYLGEHNVDHLDIDFAVSGSWSNKVTGLALARQFEYSRYGRSIVPYRVGSAAGSAWMDRDQFAGAWVEMGTKSRRIVANAEGYWQEGATESLKRAWLEIHPDDYDDSEPASGTLRLIPRRSLVLLYLTNASGADLEAIRLTLSYNSVAPPQGYFEIGTLALGPVVFFGARPDNTRSVVLEPGDEIVELDDGTRYSRTIRPTRRRAEISWSRLLPMDETIPFPGTTNVTDWNWISAYTSGEPVQQALAGPRTMQGILRQLGRKPCVYIPAIPHGTADTEVDQFTRVQEAIYGRIITDSRIETAIGAPLTGEGVRSNVYTIVEEV